MDRIIAERERTVSHVSWGAVFAGAFVGLGIWLLLHLLGMGIGMTAIDPQDTGSLREIGIGTGIWSLIAPLIGLFVGGLVAARVAGPMDRLVGAIHGAVLWALATMSALVLLAMFLGSVLGTVARAGGQVVSTAGGVVGDAASADVLGALGIRAEDLVAPVNQRLREEGKPTVTPEQVVAAAQDALRRSIREGRLDRELLVNSVARETNLSRADAQEIAAGIERRWDERSQALGARAEVMGQEAQVGALRAAETTGKALLALFAALGLGLVAAIGGATVGVSRAQRRAATVATPPPLGRPIEPRPIT
jgi:hypothetical protein